MGDGADEGELLILNGVDQREELRRREGRRKEGWEGGSKGGRREEEGRKKGE